MDDTARKASRTGKAGYVAAAVFLGASLANMAAPAVRAESGAIQDLSRYCTVCWRNARLHPDSWADCTQEVFCRLLKTVPAKDWGQLLSSEGDERREFLRAIDAVKKRSQRARRFAPLPHDVPERDSAHLAASEDRDGLEKVAARLLTARQARILELSLDGWTVQEIADRLETPAARVSDEKYKAIRKLGRQLQMI
jgi:RNA polymerase sigma factor (sigma-70 family)